MGYNIDFDIVDVADYGVPKKKKTLCNVRFKNR
ncbi:hypothetical protein ACF5W4_01790 [Bacillota bacterium Lsc_1132]